MKNSNAFLVPSNYSRIVARELGLQERELSKLLNGTGLPTDLLRPGDASHITSEQQMRVLENALRLSAAPEFGLRLGQRLQPASHGPMGYLVLSSPDVISALEAFIGYLPLSFPFSSVEMSMDTEVLQCTLELKIEPKSDVRRLLQECFALMIQSVVEAVLGRELTEATIGLQHSKPSYSALYTDYFQTPVLFSQAASTIKIPYQLVRIPNVSGHSESHAAAQTICQNLLEQMPMSGISTSDQVRRLLLASPAGSRTVIDIAQAMYITKRTLQRRLEKEGTSYREITELLNSELAVQHLLDDSMTVEAISNLLGYYDTASFRKAFHRWFGQSPSEYRTKLY